ncbi:MAG: hypothetical protein IT406_03960 [Candidatus Yanofskybacteria bacterium]|nr:hypothetical protein [Candidatus Yanofskybacteria bacterium]
MQFLDGRPGGSETLSAPRPPEEEQELTRRMLRLYPDEFMLAHEHPGEEIACEQRYTHWEVFLQLLGISFTPKLGPPPIIVWTPGAGYIVFQGAVSAKSQEVA